jgi:putative transposase
MPSFFMARLVRVVIPALRTMSLGPAMVARLRAAESIGRPLGDDRSLAKIERTTKRRLKSGRRGPTPGSQREMITGN